MFWITKYFKFEISLTDYSHCNPPSKFKWQKILFNITCASCTLYLLMEAPWNIPPCFKVAFDLCQSPLTVEDCHFHYFHNFHNFHKCNGSSDNNSRYFDLSYHFPFPAGWTNLHSYSWICSHLLLRDILYVFMINSWDILKTWNCFNQTYFSRSLPSNN